MDPECSVSSLIKGEHLLRISGPSAKSRSHFSHFLSSYLSLFSLSVSVSLSPRSDTALVGLNGERSTNPSAVISSQTKSGCGPSLLRIMGSDGVTNAIKS